MTGTRITGDSAPVARRTLVTYGVGSFGAMGFSILPGLVLLYYMTNTLGLSALLAGVLLTAAKFWDVLIAPFIGGLSDHSLLRTGSRRRYLVIGSVVTSVFFAVMFAVPNGISQWAAAGWVFAALLASTTGYLTYQIAYVTLPVEIARDYDQRTRMVSARVFAMMLSIVVFGAAGPVLRTLGGADDRLGYTFMAGISAVAVLVATLIGTRTAPRGVFFESTRPTLRESYRQGQRVLRTSGSFRALIVAFMLLALATAVMLSGAQYVATYALHSESALNIMFAALILPALIATPVWRAIAARVGKERGFVLAAACIGVGSISVLGMLEAPGPWIYAAVALTGIGYAGAQSLPASMLADVIAHEGRDDAGIFGGLWTAGENLGTAFGASLYALVLAVGGFRSSVNGADVDQSSGALTSVIIGYGAVPAVLAVLGMVAFRGYKLRRDDFAPAVARGSAV